MNEDQEIIPRKIAAEFLFGELVKVAMKQIRTMSMPFSMLREAEQKAVLDRITDDIREIVKEVIDVIASNARIHFRAEVEQVLFKDGIKAVLKMARGENAHALADIAGGFVTVVIEDRSSLLDAGDATAVDPDQKPLFDVSAQDVINRINRGAK
ncbi:MAG TPA: hypothetical protein PLR37_08735 [Candidatus Accumulibacter phosphatis]|nr:hypothetical protein [Candidatus Accumulibacter phosphatis]